MKPYNCQKCGAPGVLYHSHGHTQQRPYCAVHWAEFQNAYRHEQKQKLGVPMRWKFAGNHWLKPPEGVTRIVVDGYRNRVTVYHGLAFKTTHLKTLKRLETPRKVIELYQALGYQPTQQKRRWCVLEKSA